MKKAPLAALACAPAALAVATFSPISNGPVFAVGLPPQTSISSTSTGTIYLSLQAPSAYQWAGLGIGSNMAGATIFMMYPDGNGNVTISARDGQGYVEPQFNSSLMAGVTLLEGSGVVDGVMRANVKCTTCSLDSASTSTKSPWIAAWKTTGSVASTDESLALPIHDHGAISEFTFDLTAASLSTDANPFVTADGKPTYGSGGGSSGGVPSEFKRIPAYQKAHGVLMALAILIFFPLGSALMRVYGSPMLHGITQLLGLLSVIAGFAIGVRLTDIIGLHFSGAGRTHTVFGTVLVAIYLFQPVLGVAHHLPDRLHKPRTNITNVHTWLGRAVILCGIINAGLGFKLAANSRGGEIAFGVVAGIVGILYTIVVLLKKTSAAAKPAPLDLAS